MNLLLVLECVRAAGTERKSSESSLFSVGRAPLQKTVLRSAESCFCLCLNHLIYLLNGRALGLLQHFSWNWASLDPGQLFLLFAKFLEARNLHPVHGNTVLVVCLIKTVPAL